MPPDNPIISTGAPEMLIYYVVLGAGIVAGIAGQMLLKAGADAPTLVAQVLRPSSLLGLALYGSAAFMYMFALRKIPVSVAFPSVSLSYAIVAVLAYFLFGEPFGLKQAGGIALIIGGVMLINQA
jgi:drug/metabolite transporter (DMT)-like permease